MRNYSAEFKGQKDYAYFPSFWGIKNIILGLKEPGNFHFGRYEITDDVTSRQLMEREIARTEREAGYAAELFDIARAVAVFQILWRGSNRIKRYVRDRHKPPEESEGGGAGFKEWDWHRSEETFLFGDEPAVTKESIQKNIIRFEEDYAQHVFDCIYPILRENGMEDGLNISRPNWIF